MFSRLWTRSRAELVFRAHLDTRFVAPPDTAVVDPQSGNISDLGFADGPGRPISRRPPQAESLATTSFLLERFLRVAPGSCRDGVGWADVREAFVNDFHMRGDIDFTGVQILLTLREDMYKRYADFVGTSPVPSSLGSRAWRGAMVFRMPVAEFRFPKPRGSSDPWSTGTKGVGRLKRIRRFKLERLGVFKLADGQGNQIGDEDGLPPPGKELSPPLILDGL